MSTIPNIKLVDGYLEGTVSLPIWKDFQNRRGGYDSLDTNKESNGEYLISIGGDMILENPIITAEQIKSYEYLIKHSPDVYASILTKLFTEYENLKADYGYDSDDESEFMPDVDTVEQFKYLIGLSHIHLLNVSKEGFACVGYQFGCSWDEEHGLGFMTHKK